MKSLVVFESMYGNTRAIAEAIALELAALGPAEAVPAGEATSAKVADADFLVVGAPTHVHTIPSARTRKAALAEHSGELQIDPSASGPGIREWLEELPRLGTPRYAAVFDTRIDIVALLSGRASRAIGRRLHRRGYVLIADPESFLVDKQSHLIDTEVMRARQWGTGLTALVQDPTGAGSWEMAKPSRAPFN